MKAILKYLFGNSMKPVLFMFLALPLFILGVLSEIGGLLLIGDILFMMACLWLVLSFFVLLFRGEWKQSFYTFLFIAAVIIAIGLLAN